MLAARVDGSLTYTDVDLRGPLAIVLGSEADGLTDAWADEGVVPVRLPMLGVADSLNVSIAAAVLLYEARRQRGALDGQVTMSAMDMLDFVVIGAGPAGEAAAHKARSLGASVAIVDREWFGGSCPHVGCVPSKSLLHAAERHASGEDYPWARASARRDYMVNRPSDAAEPDDTSHVAGARGRRRGRPARRGPDHGPWRRHGHPRGHDAGAAGQERRRGGRLHVQAAARRGPRGDPAVDEPRGDAGPRAATEPAGARRRAHRL